MFSSHFKGFAASWLSLGAIATLTNTVLINTVQAQPTTQTLAILTESNFDAPPDDKNPGLQGGAGGASRSSSSCDYAVLIPDHGYSSTKESHPTIWLYVHPANPEQELFVQASLYLSPLDPEPNADIADTVEPIVAETETDDGYLSRFIDALLLDTAAYGYEFPVTMVRDRLSNKNLISLQIPQHTGGLSHFKTYLATIELGCGVSTELLDQDLERMSIDVTKAVSRTKTLLISRDATIVSSPSSVVSRSWLDTVDGIARLAQRTETPADATTATLLNDWDTLLTKTANELQAR
ncbi:hypothetical protein [[Limnothrix rosea] IAM M-220]|uniref:hypothetical protein n=1 Tax=[Limnothrix rosea] IAM M-220 TaxID=454133 RepID=UPI000966FFE2|nr:hypothetical protein [[Limnothrix rosea] IAM M-220]OKH11420.1 hypothetical protein NIES208_17300 [[Limnothrix rosea] IAM M-220]